jgi:hypothetical protein
MSLAPEEIMRASRFANRSTSDRSIVISFRSSSDSIGASTFELLPQVRYYDTQELKARGFSLTMIRRLLGTPDKHEVKRRGYMRWTANLWAAERVRAAEASAQFAGMREQARRRAEGRGTSRERRMAGFELRYQVRFEVVMTEAPQDFVGEVEGKPVPMSRNNFARAKDLIRWVLEKAK